MFSMREILHGMTCHVQPPISPAMEIHRLMADPGECLLLEHCRSLVSCNSHYGFQSSSSGAKITTGTYTAYFDKSEVEKLNRQVNVSVNSKRYRPPSPGQPMGKFSKTAKSRPPGKIFWSNLMGLGFPGTIYFSTFYIFSPFSRPQSLIYPLNTTNS